jgi:twitching motility protein PilT
MTEMKTYLKQSVEQGASDLFIVSGSPVTHRLHGHLSPMDDQRLLPPRTEELISSLY